MIQGMHSSDPDSRRSKNILLTSKNYYHSTGMYARKNKLEYITGNFETILREKREEDNIVDGPELRRFQLDNFNATYKLYSRNKVVRLYLNKAIQTRQTMDQFVSKSVAKRGVTEIYYGDGWGIVGLPSSSSSRGSS